MRAAEVLCGRAAMAHAGSRASVQVSEARGQVKQARRYRRDGVALQVPAVCTAADGKPTPHRRRTGGSRIRGSATMPGDIAAKRGDRPVRARRREGRCGCREWCRATEVPVRAGGHGPWRVEGIRTGMRVSW